MATHGRLLVEGSRLPPGGLRGPTLVHGIEPGHLVAPLLVSALLLAVGVANGGFHPRTWAWVSVPLVFVIVSALLARSNVELSALECGTLLCLLALAGWTALSGLWSVDGALSLRDGQRTLLYTLAAAAIMLLSRRGSGGYVVSGVLAGISALVTLALAIQLLPVGLSGADPFEGYLLFRPVGYANALGILAAMGLLLAGGLATRAPGPDARRIGAGLLVPLAAALTLSGSRGAALALVIGAVTVIALADDRRRLGLEMLVLCPGPLLIAVACATVDLRGDYPAIEAGRAAALALAIIVLAAITALAAPLARAIARRPVGRRSRQLAAAAAVLTALLLVAVAAARGGAPVPVPGDRTEYWAVAWQQFGDHPLVGSGAGSFAARWQESGSDHGAHDAHSLYLESLAELGSIGLVLVLTALALPVVAGLRVRRLRWVPAAIGAYVAFVVHAGLDWDWEMPVVTLAALFLGGSLLVAAAGPVVGAESTPGACFCVA